MSKNADSIGEMTGYSSEKEFLEELKEVIEEDYQCSIDSDCLDQYGEGIKNMCKNLLSTSM